MNPPSLTEAGVAAWLFELETAWRLKGEVRPARAVLALVASEKAAIIERLRVAEGLLRLSRRFVDDNLMGRFVPDISSPEILTNIDTFLEGASHVAR